MNDFTLEINNAYMVKGVKIVHLKGLIDIEAIPYLSCTVATIASEGATGIVLDFSQTIYVVATAWDFFLEMIESVQSRGVTLLIANLYGFVEKEYLLLELSSSILVHRTVELAINSMSLQPNINPKT